MTDVSPHPTPPQSANLVTNKVVVPVNQLEAFHERLAKLNAKAAAFGLSAITVKSTEEVAYWIKLTTENASETLFGRHMVRITPESEPKQGAETVRTVHMEIEYPIIKLGQWQVIAQVQSAQPAPGNLIFNISRDAGDEPALRKWASCPIGCEHCKTERPRKMSFILKDEKGELKEVGSNCLKDYTGIDPASALFMAKMSQFFRAEWDDVDGWEKNAVATGVPTQSYLTAVLYCIETDPLGFISAAKARESDLAPTYDTAWGLGRAMINAPALREKYLQKEPALRERARKIMEWARGLKDDQLSLYELNVKRVLSADDILAQHKHLALAASAASAYDRAVLGELLRQQDRSADAKTHIGQAGQKMAADLVLHRLSSFDTQFGVKHIVSMRDDQGNVVVWKTASLPMELKATSAIGKPFEATFKVKGHGDYQGVPQTEISHLKIVGFKDAQAPDEAPEQSQDDDQDGEEACYERPRQR